MLPIQTYSYLKSNPNLFLLEKKKEKKRKGPHIAGYYLLKYHLSIRIIIIFTVAQNKGSFESPVDWNKWEKVLSILQLIGINGKRHYLAFVQRSNQES